jgi:PAS domain S-box-containing protein
MTNELESQIRRLKQGDHICAIFENPRERLEVAVPFVIDGLARGERCVYILDESGMAEIVQALTAAGVAVERERQRGALRFTTPEETFLRTGKFESEAMMDIFHQAEADALANGFTGVRITGEPPWSALGREPGKEWFEYEALLSHLPTKTVILCRYNHAHFDDSTIPDVLQTHPVAILGNQVCNNPYNEPSFVPAQGPQASAEFKRKRATWWITELKRTHAAEKERERVLEQLRQSERRLAEAQQVAHIGSFERDLRTNQVIWSDELYRLFGVKPDEIELSYERFLRFLVPEDVDRIRSLLDQAIRDRGPLNFDYRIIRADGSVRVMHEQGSVIVNAAGEPIRLVGTAQDVTEQRRAQEMLEENRRLLHNVLTTLPVGVAVTDRAGDLILANPACERIWGDVIVSGHERRAKSKGFWHDSGKRIDPESWASARALSKGETSLNELIDIEAFDGQQKTIQNSAAPIRDAEGLVVGAVIVNEEVTERVRAQKALRESADRLQHLSRRLLKVQEEERRHLARELHDEFGQILATITLHLHGAVAVAGDAARPRLDECAKLLQAAGEQVRSLAIELRPTMLDTHGLEAALQWLAEQHQQRTGCDVQVNGHLAGLQFPPDLSIACFRMVQEALTNVARHAAAKHVWIELSQTDHALELVVRDDGLGFDVLAVQEHAARRGSLGLLGMAERVMLLGGSLHVESAPGRGTRIRAHFPLSEASEERAATAE